MEACKLSHDFGSHAKGEKMENIIPWKNIHVTNEKLYFAKSFQTML